MRDWLLDLVTAATVLLAGFVVLHVLAALALGLWSVLR